jgi:hypothetical protein
MKPSKNAGKLSEMIKKAIEDHQITYSEYENILELADEDGHIDPQEKQLLFQLNEMIENKTLKRVP